MLNVLRRKKIMKRILWALAIIIIPAFVLWGAGSLGKRNSPYKYVGIIEGREISFDDFVKGMQDTQVSLFLAYFNRPEILRRFRNDRAVLARFSWENMIIKEHAKKDKISVSDEEVVNFLTRFPLFLRGGVFDDKLYKYILRSSLGLTPRAFEESVRNSLIDAKYKEDIVKNITISDEEAREDYKVRFEKAKLYYVVIDKDDYKDKAEASEEEISAYYEKNKDGFREPEKIILQYIAFPHREEGAKEKALEELDSAYETLKKLPSDMENIARDLNLTIKKTMPFSRDEIVPEIGTIKNIAEISFGLRPLVDILPLFDENEIGTSYIIRVGKKMAERIKKEDEVKSSIIDTIKNEKALGLAKEKTESIYEAGRKRNLSLKKRLRKEAKKKRKAEKRLKLNKTEFISRYDYIEGVGESYELVDKAFNLKIGEVSKPIGIRKGFALIEPVKLQFIDEEEFQKEKESYREKALSMKKIKALEEWFKGAKAGALLAVDFDKL